jgi:3-deoxy-D-arabino-heptulosonate 7-phosphate (DAHP) synthase
MTKSERAVKAIIKRMRDDGRVAYLLGPFSECYELVTDAYAETIGKDAQEFRGELERVLRPQTVTELREVS